jgi:predicted MFS family arabinose efflux permease
MVCRTQASGTELPANQAAMVRKALFRTYTVCMFTMVFCVNAPAPLFELFRRASGLSPSALSMLYTVYAGIVIVMLPFFGHASDRLGRRVLIILGLGFIATGSVVLAMANGFAWLICGRLLQGIGVAAMPAPATAALAELAGPHKQAAAASTVAVALAVGGAAAPVLAGGTAEAFPGFPTLPLLVCAGMALTGLVSVALLPDPWRFRLRKTTSPSPQIFAFAMASRKLPGQTEATDHQSVSSRSDRMAFWQACTAVVACFGAQVTFFTVSGPLFNTLLASHVLLTAGCAMSALMIASGLGGILARRLKARTAIAGSMGLLAPSVCGFFGLVGVIPFPALLPVIAAVGLSHGLGYAGAMHLINETAHGGRRAAYTSRFYVAIYIGGGLPVLGMGIMQGWIGQAVASRVFSTVIAAVAIGLLVSLLASARNEGTGYPTPS